MSLSRGIKSNIPYYQKPFEGPHISRKDAIKAGLNKYFEGKTCSNGHIDFRWVSGGCNSCLNERRKNLYRRKENFF